jgi:glycerol-3-phosphate dehydrogenase
MRAPGLNGKGLRGSAMYYDAQVEYAERLVLENALSASRHGAVVQTYTRVDGFIIEDERVRGVKLTDLLENLSYTASAPLTINASGPWVDEVLAGARRPVDRMICGTKGSHLVVDEFPGAPPYALYSEARADGRPFFIIPWNGAYLIGTTDLAYDGDLDAVKAEDDEIDYLLNETNALIPPARLGRDQVRFTYSGVRPLPCRGDQEPSGITRRHFIHDHAPALSGFISIVGGKLTTYRNLSEQAVDLVFKMLGRVSPECATAQVLLPGAANEGAPAFPANGNAGGLTEAVLNRLIRIYGARAGEVLALANAEAELLEPFSTVSGAIGAEVVFSFREEMAQTLTDCLMRRTMLGFNASAGLDSVEAAASVGRKYLGWSEERAAHEISEYRNYVRRLHPRVLRG